MQVTLTTMFQSDLDTVVATTSAHLWHAPTHSRPLNTCTRHSHARAHAATHARSHRHSLISTHARVRLAVLASAAGGGQGHLGSFREGGEEARKHTHTHHKHTQIHTHTQIFKKPP